MPTADVTPYLHFSVDDVFGCLRDAFTGAYASPFAQPTFAYLRDLHERHGLCVSLYCFAEDRPERGTEGRSTEGPGRGSLGSSAAGWRLAHADGRFADEFAAAPWLRFGFHALNAGTRYSAGATPAEVARAHHDEVTDAIVRFATSAALDRAPRLHYYTGSLAAVRAMAASPHGLLGLLTADDDRAEVYHLDDETRRRVRAEGSLGDPTTGLRLFSTDLRLERFEQDVGEIVAVAGRRAALVGREPLPTKPSSVRTGAATVRAGPMAHSAPGVRPVPGARAFTHEQYLVEARVKDRLERLAREWNALGWRTGFPLDETAK
ncbi:MAG: hypothetical protein KF875_12420 [Trueperaceae bacterium]|nr:hypothetical protein [Trueperaceae bacterium]